MFSMRLMLWKGQGMLFSFACLFVCLFILVLNNRAAAGLWMNNASQVSVSLALRSDQNHDSIPLTAYAFVQLINQVGKKIA